MNLPNIRKNLQTFWGFLVLAILVLGLAASVILVSQEQELRREAAKKVTHKECVEGECVDVRGEGEDVCSKNRECRRCEDGMCVGVTRKDKKVKKERRCNINRGCRECVEGVCKGSDVHTPEERQCGPRVKIGAECALASPPPPEPPPSEPPPPEPPPSEECWLTGDFNCDGEVDLLDFEIFRDIYVEHL